jgi:hypothetical protein
MANAAIGINVYIMSIDEVVEDMAGFLSSYAYD